MGFPVPGGGGGSSSSGASVGMFGDGNDGAVNFDGTTTVLGLVPVAAVYALQRDIFCTNITLGSAVQIRTNGFRIFWNGTLTGVDVTSIIQWNGTNGAANQFGGGAVGNASSTVGTATSGGAGGNGATGAGNAGTSVTNAMGGAGGAGGTGASGAGGAGGTVTAVAAARGSLRAAPESTVGLNLFAGTAPLPVAGGAGGGGGGGDGSIAGAGAGGGAGTVVLNGRLFAGIGTIQAKGGFGGTVGAGNVGGGAGGGGGLVVVNSQSIISGAIAGWTVDVSGGVKGSPHGTGTDNAVAGSAGTAILVPA